MSHLRRKRKQFAADTFPITQDFQKDNSADICLKKRNGRRTRRFRSDDARE